MSSPESKVSSKFGAPMGREHGPGAASLTGKVSLRRVRLDSGGYDQGGAYWGHGVTLYYARDSDGNDTYVRGANREAAKAILVECGHVSEDARWYR